MKKKEEAKPQKVLIAVSFSYGTKEDGGRSREAEMAVEYMPKMPMLDKHKKNYGVNELQAACARLPGAVEKILEERGFIVQHEGVGNKDI